MTDQELKDLVASLASLQAETSRKFDETALIVAATSRRVDETTLVVKETSRKLDEVGARMGSMAQNLGDVAESFFYNALNVTPEIGGIAFDSVSPNLVLGTSKSNAEFDIVLVNGASVAIVEVKFKAHLNDLDQVEKQIERYRTLQPAHKDYKIYGGIAGQSVPANVIAAARERGLFVLQQVGTVMSSATEGMRAH